MRTINVGTDLIGKTLASSTGAPELEVSIGDDGSPTLLFGRTPVKDIEKIHCFPNHENNLFAAAVHGEFGYLAFYQNFELVSVIKTNLRSYGYWSCDDMKSVVYSPDATKAATLADTNEMTIWEIKTGKAIATHHFSKQITGILWAQNDRIIGISENDLLFFKVEKFVEFKHYTMQMEGDKPDLSYSPLGKLGGNFDINPYFPIEYNGNTSWIAAFEQGLVICENELLDCLENELCFTIGNRIALPYRWAAPNILADLKTAIETNNPDLPLNDRAKANLMKTFASSVEKNYDDYFVNVTKKEFFGKKFKKGKYTFDQKTGDYWEQTKAAVTVDSFEIPVRKAKDYQAPVMLKGAELTRENLEHLVGKAILYVQTYSPNAVSVGTLLAVYDDHCSIQTIDFRENGEQGGSGGSNSGYDYYVRIGKAEMR